MSAFCEISSQGCLTCVGDFVQADTFDFANSTNKYSDIGPKIVSAPFYD